MPIFQWQGKIQDSHSQAIVLQELLCRISRNETACLQVQVTRCTRELVIVLEDDHAMLPPKHLQEDAHRDVLNFRTHTHLFRIAFRIVGVECTIHAKQQQQQQQRSTQRVKPNTIIQYIYIYICIYIYI